MEKVQIDTEYIKLDQLLKWTSVAESGANAKYLIVNGLVKVNEEIITQRGKKVFPGDHITIELEKRIEFIVE
ncbi:MAG: ribosome-associated protein [Clostridiales bacterium]|jgi:ribosome-associated protein|nr:ribosome-associated protein [Clostridiales bacterium]